MNVRRAVGIDVPPSPSVSIENSPYVVGDLLLFLPRGLGCVIRFGETVEAAEDTSYALALRTKSRRVSLWEVRVTSREAEGRKDAMQIMTKQNATL